MPYSEGDIKKQISAIEKHMYNLDVIPNEYSSQLKELLSTMLDRTSNRRPNCTQILETIDKMTYENAKKDDAPEKEKIPNARANKFGYSKWCYILIAILICTGAIILANYHTQSKDIEKCNEFKGHSNRIQCHNFIEIKNINHNEFYTGDLVDNNRHGKGKFNRKV